MADQLAVASTSISRPCPRCGELVEPRAQRVVEGWRPLCSVCLTLAGLLEVDELLGAAAELEGRLADVLEHGSPLGAEELLGVAGRIVSGVRSVALEHLAQQL